MTTLREPRLALTKRKNVLMSSLPVGSLQIRQRPGLTKNAKKNKVTASNQDRNGSTAASVR